jgi:hypothetical protein
MGMIIVNMLVGLMANALEKVRQLPAAGWAPLCLPAVRELAPSCLPLITRATLFCLQTGMHEGLKILLYKANIIDELEITMPRCAGL